MEELLQSSLPWLLVSLTTVVLLLLVPLSGFSGRTAIAALLAIGAIASGFVGALSGAELRTLDVVNPFPQGAAGEHSVVVFEHVEAPAWQWPLVLAAMLALAAAVVLITRNRSGKPGLVLHPLMVTVWLIATRLFLEKVAAPSGLVWATGVSMSIVPIVLFVGLYASRRGLSYGRFALGIVVLAILQRLLVVAVSWFVTTQNLGTHLDMTPLNSIHSPIGGEVIVFADAEEAWWHAVVKAQMIGWVGITIVAGLLLGGVSWALTRRRGKSD